jgi:4-oxalocrotonate tautomerase family enzyme
VARRRVDRDDLTMPLIQIDVMQGLDEGQITALVELVPARYAELIEAPMARIRAIVNEVPASHWRVGGKAEPEPTPLIRIELMRGRPPELLNRIMTEISDLVAEILAIPVSRTRLLIREIEPELWAIGGVPATLARADEVAARASR